MENKDEVVLFLNKRLGFIKLAMKYGLPLVPVYAYGLEDSFTSWVPKGKFMKWLSRRIGFLPMLFFGAFGTPLGPARPCQYTNVIGKPIKVPKIENPTEEDLRKYQKIFIDEMKELYEKTKQEFGRSEVKLRIV